MISSELPLPIYARFHVPIEMLTNDDNDRDVVGHGLHITYEYVFYILYVIRTLSIRCMYITYVAHNVTVTLFSTTMY